MNRLSAPCSHCPKTVEIKFSTERFIVHDTPEGEECAGSGKEPASPDVPVVAEPRKRRKTRRKTGGKGGSVWTVSGGLPGLGRRR